MAIFKTCCCCLSLRTGCIIIGVLELLCEISNVSRFSSSPGIISGTLVGIITAALLIYGAVKRNRYCLWPWVVVSIITIILLTIGILLCIFASALIMDIIKEAQAEGGSEMTQEDVDAAKNAVTAFVVMLAIIFLIVIIIVTLLTLVVYSFIVELREEEERLRNDANAPPKAYNLVPV